MILVSSRIHYAATECAPAMNDGNGVFSGFPAVGGTPVRVAFDAGRLTSDAGVLLLAEIERRLGIAVRLARCIDDPRDPAAIRHSLAEMIRFRALLIACGYPDGNDCDTLRRDPAFKMALGRLPDSGADLCSQPTISRLENLPGPMALKRMMAAMIDLFCDSFAQVPERIVLDIARIEAGLQGTDTRFIITNLAGTPKHLYEDIYCARGQAENLIKAHKLHLASDRTSCTKATANQFRLMVHTAAYWLMLTLRGLAPKLSFWRDAQFDSIRLWLLKVAARVTEMATRIKVALPTGYN
jgi:hypothetical protein